MQLMCAHTFDRTCTYVYVIGKSHLVDFETHFVDFWKAGGGGEGIVHELLLFFITLNPRVE